MSIKQDGCVPRTPTDVDRRYKNVPGEVDYLSKKVEDFKVDDSLSTSSTNPVQNKIVTVALDSKVTKIIGKGLSTNDYTTEEKTKLSGIETQAEVNTIETIKVNGVAQQVTNKEVNLSILNQTVDTAMSSTSENAVQNKVIKEYVDSKTIYDLSTYAVSGLTILRSSCIKKNNRVLIDFVGTISMSANSTTTLFNLPAEIRPQETKDFVLFGQTTNNDGYIGYGYVTNVGLFQVRFSTAITSYIRFSFTYDLD